MMEGETPKKEEKKEKRLIAILIAGGYLSIMRTNYITRM